MTTQTTPVPASATIPDSTHATAKDIIDALHGAAEMWPMEEIAAELTGRVGATEILPELVSAVALLPTEPTRLARIVLAPAVGTDGAIGLSAQFAALMQYVWTHRQVAKVAIVLTNTWPGTRYLTEVQQLAYEGVELHVLLGGSSLEGLVELPILPAVRPTPPARA